MGRVENVISFTGPLRFSDFVFIEPGLWLKSLEFIGGSCLKIILSK